MLYLSYTSFATGRNETGRRKCSYGKYLKNPRGNLWVIPTAKNQVKDKNDNSLEFISDSVGVLHEIFTTMVIVSQNLRVLT